MPYATHQPLIAHHAETNTGFADVVTFVLATVNQRFHRVGDVLADLDTNGIDGCKYLVPHGKRGVAYARLHAETIRERFWYTTDTVERLKVLLEIPGIGIVKAGFISQLIAGEVGCLDRHNLRFAGLSERTFHRVPASVETLTLRLEAYIHTCRLLGTPATLWDTWCAFIAREYPTMFADGDEVSYKHAEWCKAT